MAGCAVVYVCTCSSCLEMCVCVLSQSISLSVTTEDGRALSVPWSYSLWDFTATTNSHPGSDLQARGGKTDLTVATLSQQYRFFSSLWPCFHYELAFERIEVLENKSPPKMSASNDMFGSYMVVKLRRRISVSLQHSLQSHTLNVNISSQSKVFILSLFFHPHLLHHTVQ